MQIVVFVDNGVFRSALQAAREIQRADEGNAKGMFTVITDDEAGWVERLWAKIDHALTTARQKGREAARDAIDGVEAELAELGQALGHAATAVRDIVIARLSAFVRSIIQGLLSRVQPDVTIGEQRLPVRRVTIEQKIKMSGSLKASLEEICEFIAEGELSLAADYGGPA